MTKIPKCLTHLPLHGGLPIPYTTPMEDGRPNFRATDGKKHNMCLRYGLCGTCGKHIPEPPYVFMVAPLCLAERLVFNTPQHEACARAAFELCPFLSREKWARNEDANGGVRIYELEELPAKPARPGLAFVASYYSVMGPKGMLYAALPPDKFPVQWFGYHEGVLTPEGLLQAPSERKPYEAPAIVESAPFTERELTKE